MIVPLHSGRARWRGRLLAVLLVLLALPTVRAQQRVQVVTRTLEQTWHCPPGMRVRIRAEKASVQVRGWDRPTVQVTLHLSARHAERAVAVQDLPVAQYRLQQNGNALDLVNLFVLPAGAPAVRSDLRAEYIVLMPSSNPLQVVNAYGQTSLTDLSGAQELTQNFGQITLRNLRGTLTITAHYADLTATNVQADFSCEANKSAVQLLGVGGQCRVRAITTAACACSPRRAYASSGWRPTARRLLSAPLSPSGLPTSCRCCRASSPCRPLTRQLKKAPPTAPR
jgi:hypothetical protein